LSIATPHLWIGRIYGSRFGVLADGFIVIA
jgi:hypothetical protein